MYNVLYRKYYGIINVCQAFIIAFITSFAFCNAMSIFSGFVPPAWAISGLPPPLPPTSFAAVLITGSHDNITDNPPYLQNTYTLLKKLREQMVPILGICFGHQLLAAAFGGRVTNLKKGPEFGAVKIKKTSQAQNDRLFAFLPQEFWAFMSHQQTVQKLPPKAITLASSPKDQNAAFYLEPNIWGVQFHPEFDQQIMAFYLKHHFNISDKEAKSLLLPCPQESAVIPQFLEKVL